jgi:hypothetical protein
MSTFSAVAGIVAPAAAGSYWIVISCPLSGMFGMMVSFCCPDAVYTNVSNINASEYLVFMI